MNKFEYYAGREDIQWFPEAAGTQSFKKGQMVYLVAGKLTICVDQSQAILGIADADATGTTNTWLPVVMAHSTTRFVGYTTDNGSDVTVTISMLCLDCDLHQSATASLVDVGNVGTAGIRVVALHPDHIPVGVTATVTDATNARVIFKVIDAYSQATDLAM